MTTVRDALVDALEGGPVAGDELAERLGVPREAVREQVGRLRREGWDIDSTAEEYVVRDVDAYDGASISFGLDADFDVEYHDSLGSSNDRARELAEEGADDVVVVADEQTGARGRLDRAWSSPPGGVWFSVLVRPERPPAEVPVFTLATAVAVARACREAGVDARIKWPNDVLVPGADSDGDADSDTDAGDDVARGGAKLSGILTEMETDGDGVAWLVVGVGVNANVDPAALPEGATSLRARRGDDVDRRRLLQRILEEFDRLRESPETVLDEWRELAATLGQRVRVETPGGVVEGEAVDVAFPGSLVVRTDDGEERRVHAGDCQHLRPV